MNQLGFPLLSIVVFVPLLGAVVTLFLGQRRALVGAWALVVTLGTLALACVLWGFFDYGQPGMQFVERYAWIDAVGISYHIGLDGVSLWLVLLAALLNPVAVLVSWKYVDSLPAGDVRAYFASLLFLETAVLGVFVAVDLILFFVFWEAMLVPMYFLIGRLGGDGDEESAARRAHAALKFFLYTMAGSALMLIAIIVLAVLNYEQTGVLTFDLGRLYDMPLGWWPQLWLFGAFALAFAVKAPIWPFHSWLPEAYVESPAPVTILLAGVLSKMAIYGLIRFCVPLFPEAVHFFQPWIWLLAIVSILYGSLIALVQRDMKRLVAYSSLAHVGLIVAGLMAVNMQGLQGALLQSVSHGLTVAALFILVEFLERRRGTRLIESLGGLWQSIPILGTLLLTVILASIGLPGLSGFPGEFAMLVGVFQESAVAAAFASLGIVLGAWYMLDLFRKAFTGPLDRAENRTLPDLRRREALVLLPLIVLMFVIGILPNLILSPTDAAVDNLLTLSEDRRIVLLEEGREGVAWLHSDAVSAASLSHTWSEGGQ